MAFVKQSISEIYSQILSEKASFSSLSGLTSPVVDLTTLLSYINSNSKVAIWNLWAYITAVSSYSLQSVMELFIAEIKNEIANAAVGSVAWMIEKAKEFQYGDILQIDPSTFKPYYTSIDTSKQIISECVGLEQNGYLILKVRRLSSNILSTDELNAFVSYIHSVKFAGVRVQIRNTYSDKLKIPMTILYNPQESLSQVQSDVEGVINTYIKNIEFDSNFKTNSLIDKLQALPYVKDIQFSTLYAKPDGGTYIPFMWSNQSYSGYYDIDGSFPLSSTIIYTPIF